MRRFYLEWSPSKISETLSRKIDPATLARALPLSWSHYVRLLGVENLHARAFYETEALRGGWSVRQLDRFTHADAGQMHLYLNYAREHWTLPDENPPVGLILCAKKDHAVAHYALEGLPNKVLASEYRTTLPDERKLAKELERTRLTLDARAAKRLPAGLPNKQ